MTEQTQTPFDINRVPTLNIFFSLTVLNNGLLLHSINILYVSCLSWFLFSNFTLIFRLDSWSIFYIWAATKYYLIISSKVSSNGTWNIHNCDTYSCWGFLLNSEHVKVVLCSYELIQRKFNKSDSRESNSL